MQKRNKTKDQNLDQRNRQADIQNYWTRTLILDQRNSVPRPKNQRTTTTNNVLGSENQATQKQNNKTQNLQLLPLKGRKTRGAAWVSLAETGSSTIQRVRKNRTMEHSSKIMVHPLQIPQEPPGKILDIINYYIYYTIYNKYMLKFIHFIMY